MLLGTFGLGPNLVPTPGIPKTNAFGHIRAWAQFGPNSRNAQNECFWAHSGLGPIWSQLPECPKRMLLGTFGLGPNLVPTPGMPKTNAFGHIRAWAQFGPNSRNAQNECSWTHSGLGPIWSQLPECPKRMLLGTFGLGPNLVPTPGMPKTNAFGHIRTWAQFGPNSQNSQNECFWAHSGLGPIWSQLPECPKRMLLGTFGLGPNLVPTLGMPKTNAFGHIRAWAQFGPNSRNAQNECSWAHSGLGPVWSQLPECPKRMLLGTFGLGPNLVPTPEMPKTNALGHIRAWAQFGPNSRNAENECFWAHSGLGPIWSQLPEFPKRMLLGTFGLGPNLVPTPEMPKTNAFGHIRAWAQFGPNSRNAENECFWAHSGLGPIWSQLPEFPKRMLLGTFGLGPNLVPTPEMPKTNAFGHIRAWAQFGPNSRNAQNECFWAHSGLGPIWSQLSECPKRMLLATFGLGPNLVPTPEMPKTNALGHIRAWAQFGPNSRNAQNECFWAHSGLGPIWSQLPECPKRMLLGTFGLGPNLVPTPRIPKTNAFGHIRAWAQFGPNSRNAQNECFWAHSGLGPIWSQHPECPKRMLLGTFGLGPNLVPTPGIPKTNAFGHIRAWAQFGPNSRNAQNECFWAHSGLGPIWSQLPECPKRMLLGTFGLGPNLVPTLGMPKTNAFGHIRAWAQFGPNSRNAQNECSWTHSGLGPIWSQLPECPKRMLLGTFGLGPNLVPTPGMPKTNAFGHIRTWAQFGPNSQNSQNECFWAHSGLGPIWSQLPECPKRMLLGTFGLGPNLVPTPGMPKTNAFGHIRAWAQFGPNSRNSQNECFWAHSGLGPIWSQLPKCPKRMLLGTFGLGPNLVPTPEMPKTNAFGHIRAWAQFGPNSRNAQNECFWAHSGLGPNWSQLPECPKRMLLGTFGLGPNLVPTPGMPKTNAFGHIRAWGAGSKLGSSPNVPKSIRFGHSGSWDQIGPNPECAQKHSFWAFRELGPNWAQARMCPKAFVLGIPGNGTKLGLSPNVPKSIRFGNSGSWDQIGLKPECARKHSFWAFRELGPNWAQPRMCPKAFVLGIPGVGTKLGPSPNVPKSIRFGHSGSWDQIGPKPECAQKHSFWEFRELEPNWAQARMCPKAFVLGISGVGTKLGPSPNVPKSIRFGNSGSWDQIDPKPECAQKHSFWAFRELGPNWAQARMCPKAFVLGIPGVGTKLGPSPNVPKSIRFGHFGSWDQIGPKPECAQKHSFWAFRELGPNWAQARMCPKAFVLRISGVGTKLGPSPNVPKSIRFGNSGSWDQIGPKPECAQKHLFWAFRELGPNWAQARMCPKAFVLGISGVRTKLGPSPNVPKSIRFGHFGSWDQIGPKPECAQKHSFWAFRELGPNWSQARMCPKAFVLGISGVGTKLGPSPNVPKSIRFGNSGSWDQIGPKPECAQKHSFWAFRELGPNWAQARMCPKAFVLGISGVGTKLGPSPNVPKSIRFGHSASWDQIGPKPECAQKHSFWAFRELGPVWAQARMCPKAFVLGISGVGTKLGPSPTVPKSIRFGHFGSWDQIGPKPECAQKHSFWEFRELGPNWAQARMCPKAFVLGIPGVGTKLGLSPNVPKSIRFGNSGSWDQIGPKPECAQKHSFWAFRELGPNWAQARMCPKAFVLGIPGVGTKLGPSPNVPKSIRFGHSGSWDQIGPKPEGAQEH